MDGRGRDRNQLIYLLRVTNAADGGFIGQVADITPIGLMIVCPESIEPGHEYLLSIELPREMTGPEELLLKGLCKWCRPDTDPIFYSCGFAFIEISQGDTELIRTLIDEFLYEEPEDDELLPETDA